ncbi:glycosyl transferase family 2 [Rhodopirellula sp. SM50]|nr:glycosyltransferase family 2 protein [Rhodopirellula sp. SM50]PAY21299.1 glycosyl transferase family 2 [Rhodopirellula sp. SM50]
MLNIVIPMAGHGSRFQQAGYQDPKPLIPVHGVPMIRTVIDNLRPACDHKFFFLCQSSHISDYPLESILRDAAPGCEIRTLDRVTAGAACTVLLASDGIDNQSPLMIANCDQWIDASIDEYLNVGMQRGIDAFLMTMNDDSPKWSYVQRDDQGEIIGVIEKEVVSSEATVGIYNFAHGADFVSAAKDMIRENDRSKNEFYVAPVYSRLIRSGQHVETVSIGDAGNVMHGLGTPEDLEKFVRRGFESRIQTDAEKIHCKRGREAA